MGTTLTADATRDVLARLTQANRAFAEAYPGDRPDRQPVHTVYGGVHLFTAGIAQKLGAAAIKSLDEYGGNFVTFAKAINLPGTAILPEAGATRAALEKTLARNDALARKESPAAWFAQTIYNRVREKLEREPVEDHRLDFEDGYGNRPDAEEDGHAITCAEQVALGMAQHALPPFIGIRIKPFNEELRARSLRTLDLFLSTLAGKTGGKLPDNFVVTLPKVTVPEQVTALVESLELLERALHIAPGAVRIELMVETPQSVIGANGEIALPGLVRAARGRCRGAHFGTYDYTAGCNITAAHQLPQHPACDFARHVMQVSLAGTGVTLSDGATTIMPVGPHRPGADGTPITDPQQMENWKAVHRGWKAHYDDVRSSLRHGYYQGWDLNPAQLPTRYAAVFAFFLETRDEASARLKAFVAKAAQATLLGNIFDDAATGQGLLNFFLRGINCGALTEEEALATGLTLEELRGRSFVKILDARKGVAR